MSGSGVMAGAIGADIGYTKAMEDAGRLPAGTTIVKASTIGMQLVSAGAGARWATSPKTISRFRSGYENVKTKFGTWREGYKQAVIQAGETGSAVYVPKSVRAPISLISILLEPSTGTLNLILKLFT